MIVKVSELTNRWISSRLSRRPSASYITVGTRRMLVSTPKPSRNICIRGMVSEKNSVPASRRMCRASLKKTAPKPRKMSPTGGLLKLLMLVRQFDENVFQTGSERANLGDGDPFLEEALADIFEVEMIVDERVDGLPEDGGAADTGKIGRASCRERV